MIYRLRAIVKKVEEKQRLVEAHKDKESVTESLGFWVIIKDANMSFFLGYEKPEMETGDELMITIEKRDRR